MYFDPFLAPPGATPLINEATMLVIDLLAKQQVPAAYS
jgi:hypothetical protein